MNLECRMKLSVQYCTVTDKHTYGCQAHLPQIIFLEGGGT